jgi:hypothetical protein
MNIKSQKMSNVKFKILKLNSKPFIFVCFVLTLSGLLVPVRAADDVEIISHTGYIDSEGNYRVVGEVSNIGNQAVTFVQVTATFYDSNNNFVASRFDLTVLKVILEGRKSPFELALLDVADSARVFNYSLSVTYLESDGLPKNLEILSYFNYTDSEGDMHINGTLKNNGDKTLVDPKVVATFYDKSATVVATSLTSFYGEGDIHVNPNQSVPFEIILGQERTPYVDTFVLTAESNEYALIPEFPVNSVFVILCISFVAFALQRCINKKEKSIGDPS